MEGSEDALREVDGALDGGEGEVELGFVRRRGGSHGGLGLSTIENAVVGACWRGGLVLIFSCLGDFRLGQVGSSLRVHLKLRKQGVDSRLGC